jgi:hypothetical protein
MGYAILTADTQRFLDTCDAVKSWDLLTDDVAVFDFDASEEVNGPIPHGVYFDLDLCESGDHERRIREAVRTRNTKSIAGE